ncbi:MAG: IS110 family transposase [Acidobacteriaceae bacterium]|nr:IS110 family transposase [Acidobacteriaceae bacterium]
METFVGLDVSQEVTHVCVVDAKGAIVWNGQCASTPTAMSKTIEARAPSATRIGLESGPLSTWHWHALKSMNLPVICIDARHTKAALSMQVNKTDKNDAAGIAQIIRMGWYKEVGVKSLDSHEVRAMLGVRSRLVGMRTEVTNQLRGVLKNFGVVLGKGKGLRFADRVQEIALGDGILHESLRCLLTLLRNISEQISCLDERLAALVKDDKVCRHLMTVPGVGPVTAASFVSAIDDPAKFKKSRDVGAYFGLTPKRYQSGEVDRNGRISKCGDGLVRKYLYEAATTLLTRVNKWSALKAWGLRLAKRSGMKKAIVAVARKLAVAMHAMWTTGEVFRWSNAPVAA